MTGNARVPDQDEVDIAPAPAAYERASMRGGVISIIAQGADSGLQFLAMAALARLIAPNDFGLMAMATTLTGLVMIFSDLGLSTAAIQVDKLNQNLASAFFRINLVFGVAIALLLVAAAPVAAYFYGDPRLTDVVTLLAGPIVIMSFTRQHSAMLQRRMEWRKFAIIAISATLLGSCAAIISAWLLEWGYYALIVQGYVGATVTTLLLLFFCRWKPGPVQDWAATWKCMAFGLHFTGFQFINYFHRQFDDVLIGRRWGAEDLGQYNRAYVLLTLPNLLFSNPLARVVLPALSRTRGSPLQWQNIYLTYLLAVSLSSSALGLYFFLFPDLVVAVVFGPGWDEAADVLRFLAISIPAAGAMHTAGTVYASTGNARGMNRWALFSTPLLVTSYIVGLPYGAQYVALFYSIMVLALFVPCLWAAMRRAPMDLAPAITISIIPMTSAALLASFAETVLDRQIATHDAFVFIAVLPLYCILSGLGLILSRPGRQVFALLSHNGIAHIRN